MIYSYIVLAIHKFIIILLYTP